jgi:hypothetical protein
MSNMVDKKTTKQTSKERIAELEESITVLNAQLMEISNAYQGVVASNGALQGLVGQYERTINLLTARLIERQQSQG